MAKLWENNSADPTALNTSCSEAISVLKRRLFESEAITLCINEPRHEKTYFREYANIRTV